MWVGHLSLTMLLNLFGTRGQLKFLVNNFISTKMPSIWSYPPLQAHVFFTKLLNWDEFLDAFGGGFALTEGVKVPLYFYGLCGNLCNPPKPLKLSFTWSMSLELYST